jgi:hypothetical protein
MCEATTRWHACTLSSTPCPGAFRGGSIDMGRWRDTGEHPKSVNYEAEGSRVTRSPAFMYQSINHNYTSICPCEEREICMGLKSVKMATMRTRQRGQFSSRSASTMADMVEITPSDALRFKFQLNKQLLATISLNNPGANRLAFKIKTTAPRK